MRKRGGRTVDGSRRAERWLLHRADLAVGGSRLLALRHPLLPDFDAALPVEEGLLLSPSPPPPAPLPAHPDRRAAAAFLTRLAALASFLKFHGLGIAFEEVARLGSAEGDPARPALSRPPVPEWQAVPPPLLVAAAAVRLGGGAAGGPNPDLLRRSIERALESGAIGGETSALAVEALQVHATGSPTERLVGYFARRSEKGALLGPDLLGLALPAVVEGPGDGAIRSSEGDAALFVVRGAARRSSAGFLEVSGGDRLEEGSALRRLARLLGDDPRADDVSALAEGRAVRSWAPGPPVAIVALGGDVWDDRSRRALEEELPGAGFRLYETRSRPVRPWEARVALAPRLEREDVAALLWLPFRSWSEAAAAWDAVATRSGGNAGRFQQLARSLAAAFDPSDERRVGTVTFRTPRAGREPLLSAASLLAPGFTEGEVAAAGGHSAEEAAAAILAAEEAGVLDREAGGGFRFADEKERRRRADRLSSGARASVVERLSRSDVPEDRLAVAALARGSARDVERGAELFAEAVARDETERAALLLSRAPEKSSDLGRPDLAFRLLAERGPAAKARAAARRLPLEGLLAAPLRERTDFARLLARAGEGEKALDLVKEDGSPAARFARVEVLLALKRTDEAARTLEAPPAPDGPASAVARARLGAEIASRRGDLGSARLLLAQASSALSGTEDREEARAFLMTAGFVAVDSGRFGEARALFRRARELSPDPRRRADAALDAATASILSGEFVEAEEELSAALALYAEAGDEERYLSALGNRIDLALRSGRFDLARETLAVVLRHDARPGREHQFLFAVPSQQELAMLDADDEGAADAFREAERRRAAAPSHPAWREILTREGARLLRTRRPEEARALLESAERLPDNREQTEPLRARLLASALSDLGLGGGAGSGSLDPADAALLRAEEALRSGVAPPPAALARLESLLGEARGAASVVDRLLEWQGRFPAFFSRPQAARLLETGRRAAARAGLPAAALRFETALGGLTVPAAPAAPRRAAETPFVAEDAETRRAVEEVRKVARTKLSVLILGETGTGKELLAREVHRLSERPGPFVPVNVAALTGSLIESELFGHARGAFTGADRDRKGLVEEASGGTLFLDEIGDLALPLQAKLLRVLQEGEIRRVGETRTRPVDVRIVSATHRDLKGMVDGGSFRRDLLYRLAGLEVELPPLRKRARDLRRLVAAALGGATLSDEARTAVLGYPWPGNIRELLTALEAGRALAAPSTVVELEHLPPAIRPVPHSGTAPPGAGTYRERVADAKRRVIAEALEANGGNRTRAARMLGLSRQSLLYEMKVLGLKP